MHSILLKKKLNAIQLSFDFVYIIWIIFFEGSAFGQVSVTFEIDNISCNGDEARLVDCTRSSSSHNCGENEEAGAICY